MYAVIGRERNYPKYGRWFFVPVIDGSDDGTAIEELENYNPLIEALDREVDFVREEYANKEYPTDWFPLEDLSYIEYRRLSPTIYDLRSKTHVITLNQEGIELFKDDSLAGLVIFEDWCNRHRVEPMPRKDI